MKYIIATLLLTTSLAGELRAQTGSISGKITDDKKQPVQGAIVSLMDHAMPKYGTTTDSTGYYILKNVPVGRYELKARSLDHNGRFYPGITIAADKDIPFDITLYPKTKLVPVGH